jgi:hypothetical protein
VYLCAALCTLQEAALTRVSKMRDVFNKHFSLDAEGTPRTWRPKENIPLLARAARRQAAQVLALLVSTKHGIGSCGRGSWCLP